MKLIHCADLHLDSKMTANLDRESAKLRKAELLDTYARMIAYAESHAAEAILIAGDLFDTKNISATAKNAVMGSIKSHPAITFYYLRGNHDNDNFLADIEELPDNLKLFGKDWTQYELAGGSVALYGLELSKENSGSAYMKLQTNPAQFNIVTLHGQEAESTAKDKAEVIDLRALRGKGIDYLALGHIHGYKEERLDARGIYCYPGCLEGRGFDECGEHGFVVLTIDEASRRAETEFVPFAKRRLYEVEVDVTGLTTTAEMVQAAESRVAEERCTAADLVKFVLTGMVDVECEKDLAYFEARFRDSFFFVKAYDETKLRVEIADFMRDESLKGEFVRQVMANKSLAEEEKNDVIRYGLQALAGELTG
jgi:DNA repair exonuclease SbcCD nuclease subunit